MINAALMPSFVDSFAKACPFEIEERNLERSCIQVAARSSAHSAPGQRAPHEYRGRLCVLVGALVACSVIQLGASPAAVEVWANIEIKGYTYGASTNEVAHTNAYSYTVRSVVSPSQWFLESHAQNDAVIRLYSDGTNTYDTFEFTRDYDPEIDKPRGRMGGVAARVPGAPHPITLIPSLHPMNDMSINVPWMAYCSASYLNQPERLIPLPGPWHMRHSPYAIGYRDETVRFNDGLGLPRSIELYVSKALMRQSPHRELLIRNTRMTDVRGPLKTPVPFDEGDLHCRYLVLESTNVNGWHIPLEFRLVLEPHFQDGRLVGVDVVGRTEEMREVSSVPQFHPPPGRSRVVDLRIRDEARMVDAVAYGITNEPIPALDDPRIEQALIAAQGIAPLDPVPALRRRTVLLYCVLAGFVLFAVFVISRGRRGEGQQQNQ